MSFENLGAEAPLEPLGLIDEVLWHMFDDLTVRDDDLLQRALLFRDALPLRDDSLIRDALRRRNALLPREDDSSAAFAHSLPMAPPPPPRRLKQGSAGSRYC
jgi:hypothetical protein